MSCPVLSVVVPCFNEEEVIALTHQRLIAALAAVDGPVEVVYVDDGSRDRTWELLQGISAADPRVRCLALTRNFGHQMAVSAGLEVAAGRAVAVIDADLQDPPELLPEMLARWRAGVDVVYGRRMHRDGETAFKRLTAALFYRILGRLSTVQVPLDTGDFRLMDRRVVEALRAMPEHDRFLRGMVAWIGFRQEAFPYDRKARAAGETKYPLRKMLAFAIDGMISFSIKPLRLAIALGLFASVLAAALIVYILAVRLLTSQWVEGWAFLATAVCFFGGTQLLCLGIIGEYVGRTYQEGKGRPLYLVREDTARPETAAGRAP